MVVVGSLAILIICATMDTGKYWYCRWSNRGNLQLLDTLNHVLSIHIMTYQGNNDFTLLSL